MKRNLLGDCYLNPKQHCTRAYLKMIGDLRGLAGPPDTAQPSRGTVSHRGRRVQAACEAIYLSYSMNTTIASAMGSIAPTTNAKILNAESDSLLMMHLAGRS
jgi:hypothetical protein